MAQSIVNEAEEVLEIVPETAQEFAGFATNPAPLLVAQYERIAKQEMQALPFYHPAMPIVAECTLFEGQWLGCVLTPWMLSVVVLPGPDQLWPVRSSDRLALQLPCGNLTFMVGALPETGQLLTCSLMSPIDPHLGADEGRALVSSTLKMLLSLPVQQGEGGVNLSRRRLFSGRRGDPVGDTQR
ncbi:hydrogenase-2 assembly chaperone [Aeromonas hydrophila]|uniref:hydrogenase-2 assembly chaperone n=1 Tax=Aeromonas hydrophila TaxID=644 RepID=UPI0005D82AE5|nr:hydrogenase-2 assembly chaperone [Aeromonas hydrophila]AKA17033.1 hydrogenase biosynthesis protein HybE [Aeromonas hydrophila]MCR3949679.1 hydrogenase-2 assembly chaperone [Aeromonas hydrophila]MCW4615628.1 hydrogenase-2 assembly chaperone [Aeromonas hydrophila]HAT2246786.1 hydrogenase-2 assembly chaperone [Aeromonas hydrophila]HAT2382216.1 hydrogenase-2 assembly chaperone [Aeromonas hydrophila]